MEVTAQSKRECPSCGAEAEWNPREQRLKCKYCGTVVPFEAPNGEVVENDLKEALSGFSDSERGWGTEKVSVRCIHCNAISVFDPGTQGDRCDFCGSSQLVPFEENQLPFRPESVLPLKVDEGHVRSAIRSWTKKRWFAPNGFSKNSATDTLSSAYLPYWTFDAQASANWQADAGYYYYVNETVTDARGNRAVRPRREVRWERASGRLSHFFDDLIVPASKGVSSALLNAIGPFPTEQLVPFDSVYLSGHTVEHYQIDLAEAARSSRIEMENRIRVLCSRAVPGDTQRDLRVHSSYSGLTFKHILAPVWIVSYRYGSKSYQVLANGITGQVVGERPYSWVKILLFVLMILCGAFLLTVLRSL